MQLENYFDFLSDDDIRLKNTRIGIETILYAYIHQHRTAEDIAQTYPQLTPEQIHATILYYLHNKTAIAQYLTDWLDHTAQGEQNQDQNPSEIILKLRQMKRDRLAISNG
jgi:uncharacterized protein (DUF433 family)